MSEITINNRIINIESPTYIIAELSANHNNDFDLVMDTLVAMKEAGADAVKLQTYRPDTITLDSDLEIFRTRKNSLGKGRKYYELYEEAYMPWEWTKDIIQRANELGMDCFSSPFDFTAVDFLENLNVPAYKIASLEILDIPLIKYVAQKNKPIIISTGIASIEDIDLAVKTCIDEGNSQIALLRCTSAYPTPLEEVNLNSIKTLAEKYNLLTGVSDHTTSNIVPSVGVALGARIIEKHFILDKAIGGVDSSFSLDKDEFKEMVKSVRDTETTLGSSEIILTEKMTIMRKSGRSLFAVENIKSGELLTEKNVKSIRPGMGLHPKYYWNVLGKIAMKDIERGTPLNFDLID